MGAVTLPAELPSVVTLPAELPVTVIINDEVQVFDVAPQIIEGRTMLPLRAIGEALGMEVEYDVETATAVLTINDKIITHVVGTSTFNVDGEEFDGVAPSVIIDGRTLMPLRMLADAIGADVEWDAATRTAIITTN